MLLGLLLIAPIALAEEPRVHDVLLLHTYSADNVYTEQQRAAIQTRMQELLQPGVEARFHNEFLDAEHVSPSLRPRFAEFLVEKYQQRPPAVLLTTDTGALDFLCAEGRGLFPGVPLIFCAALRLPCALEAIGRPATGVLEVLELDCTLGLIQQLHPAMDRLVALAGPYPFASGLAERLEAAADRLLPRVAFERLPATSLDELRAIAPDSGSGAVAVLCGHPLFNDAPPSERGRAYDALALPVYVLYSTHLGDGAVGGCVVGAGEMGRTAAALACRVLAGEDAAAIPAISAPHRYMFDERALRRFGIPVNDLPAGSEIQWREPSLWSRYRWHLIGAIATLALVQSVVIFELIRQRRVRSRVSRELAASEERYRRLLDTCPDGIVVLDGHSIVFANRSAARLAGLSQAELLIGRSVTDFVVEADRALVAEKITEAMSSASPAPVAHFRARRVDGGTLTLWARGVACDHGGRPALQVVLRDDSLEQRLQSELAQVQKMEAVGTLAGGVAHDFNNLLTAVLGHASLALSEAELPSTARRSLTQIRGAAERGARLTRQLVSLARGQPVETRVLDLNQVIRDLRDLIQRILHDAITFRIELSESLWSVRCDTGQVEQVLINLAANARDAMPRGGELTIRTENVEMPRAGGVAETGEFVAVHVQDNGVGIPPEIHARIFEPFFTTKPFGQGSGLGLASVHAIMTRHGGRIDFDSVLGAGSAFHLYFPRSRETPPAPASPESAAPPAGTETILLVEDRAEILEVAESMLRSLGYSVLAAQDGPTALRMAAERAGPVDLLFTDVVMPQMSGPQLAQRLIEQFPDLCVLYATGYAAGALPELQVDAEYALLNKPYTQGAMAEKIRELLDSRERRRPLATAGAGVRRGS